MKISYSLDRIHTTGSLTITLGSVHATTLSASAEQLAAAWNRPLAEVRARLLRLSTNPTIVEIEQFGRWLMEKGMNPNMKNPFHGGTQ